MADKKFTLTFDVEGNLSPIKGAVKDFQSTIKSAKFQIPVGIQGNIDKTISKLNAEIAEFESLTSQGFSNMADIGKAEKSFTKITSLMRQLSSQGEQIKGLDPKKFLPKEILDRTAKLEKAFNKLGDIKINTKKIESQTEAVRKQREEVEELKTKYEALAAENKTSGARKGNLSSSIKSKEKELEAIQKQMEALEKVKGGKSSAEYSKLNSEFKTLSKTISAQKAEFASLDTSINKNKTTMSGLKVQIDSASSSLDQMEEQLKQLQLNSGATEELENLRKELAQLKNVNIDEIPSDLEEIKRIIGSLDDEHIKVIRDSLKGIEQAADNMVPSTQKAADSLDDLSQEGKELTRIGQEIENLKGQVLDFFSITNTIQIFKNAVRDAFDTVKELDAVMTETAVVTDFSIGDMWDKLPEYADQANKLGASIKDLYAANTLYYQQGLNSQQAMSVGVETMKMARIANMDAAKATEAMTAALRGFNMEINEISAGRINDVYSELAAITASDTEQIATAMSKTASIAASANMEFETTAALLAQIIETTQEAPETAGTAMKTIIARFTEVKELFSEGIISGEDSEGEEININKIDAALKTVGISLKDFLNGSKGIDDIFLELASKWNSLDLATQRYIATTAAGSRQQSRFIAMMSNYDRTMELVTAANNSAGASQKQFGKTLESLDAKLQRLSNAWDTFVMGLADNDIIKFGVDLLTKLLETINNLTDDLGGTAGGIAKLGIAIAALKTGKNLFNSIFDITPLKQKVSEATGVTGTFAQALTKMGVSIKTETEEKVKAASASINKFTGGLMTAGVACGALAQYLRSIGMEEFAKGLEMVGGALIAVASGLNLVNSVAVAAGTTVPALLKSIGAALLPILPYILAIAAAIGAVVYILKKVYDKSAAGRLKAAQKDTQRAAEAAKEAAEEYNNLNSAISSIEDKTNTLGELTKGTQEWRDAVVALNGEILSLVEAYPELASFLSNEGGVLKIDYEKTAINKHGEEYTAQDVLDSYLRKQVETQQIYNQNQVDEKRAETDYQYDKTMKEFSNTLASFENEESDRISDSETRQIVDKLAVEIAKGNVQTDEASIQSWLNKQSVQTQNFEEFDYSAFKTYGDYLIAQQDAIDGLTDATIAAHMAMLKLSNVSSEATEAVTNFDENILRDAYNAQLDEAKKREITQDDYSDYAKEMGYTYEKITGKRRRGGPRPVRWAYKDEEGKEVKITEDQVRDFIVNKATNEDFAGVLQKMAEHYDNADEREQELFTEIFSNGIQELSHTTLAKYATFQDGSFALNQSEESKDALAKAMNFEDFDDMAKILEIGPDQLAAQLNEIFVAGGAEFVKARKNLVKNMSKYSSKDMQGYELNAAIFSALELKFGEQISGILDGVIASLKETGDQALISKGYEQFRDIAMTSNEEGMSQVLSFIEEIDWSNPIDAVYTLNQEIQKGSGLTADYAKGMMEIESSFFGAGNQMQYFLKSNDFKEMQEDLTEIVELNGELTASDVLELADDYKSLNKILKNTEATAGGVAKALQLVAEGKLGIYQLTDAVMASLEGFNSLDSLIAETLKTLEEFDPGPNENEVAEFINTAYETISANLKAGAVGNTQNFSYLDFLFPGWRDGKEGDELVAQMEYLTGKLEDNAVNMRHSWSDIAAQKDIYGKDIQFDEDSGRTIDDLNVQDTGSEILLTGWEGKGMTTNDIVDWIADAYEVSDDYARMMLADFKNYSAELAVELNANDYAASIGKAYEELNTVKVGDVNTKADIDKKIIDESEIAAIATLYNQSFDTVYNDFKNRGALITDFYDENGLLEETTVIMAELDKVAQSGGAEGAQWVKQFIDASTSNLNIDELNEGLGNVGIPEEAKARITQDIIDSMMAASGAESMMVDVTLSDGSATALEITPNINLETAIANAETELANSKLADSIVSAFSNVTISPQVDTENMTGYVISAIKAADGTTVVIAPDQESLNTITSSVTGAAQAAKPYVHVSSNISSIISSINSISRTVTVTVKYQEVDKPANPSENQNTRVHGGGGGTFATGIKKSPRNFKGSLVSEEGPELIQKANGGAYLSGTEGPEIVDIEKGDTVYTAEETKEILKKRSHNEIPRYASGYGYGEAYLGKGSGGRSSDSDEETWENPFDKLYSLVRKIDEELRQRERIERRYEKLLDSIDASASKIVSVSREELAQLEKERMLQEALIAGRKSQISQYQSENADLSAYANVVQNERGESVLRINWDLIDQVTDPDKGARIEEYVSQMEEWFDSLEQAEDALWDIEDAVEEIKERGKDQYFELEDAIKDALVQSYQEEIDKLSEINTSINDTNSALLDAMQSSLDKQRQERDNKRTEDDLAEKQRRLLYLQQDTSGANAMEILQLQKEVEEGQEDYTDSLIDQKISELQEQNDEAAKQREQQIILAQTQLDHYVKTGQVWNDVYALMNEGLNEDSGLVRGSHLEELLKNAEGFQGMSAIKQMEWMKDTNNMIAQALAYLEIGRQLEDIGTQAGSQIEFTTSDGRTLTGTVNEDGSVTASDGQTYNNVFQGYDGNYYAGENINDVEPPKVEDPAEGQGGGEESKPQSKNNPYGVASNQGNYTARNGTMWSKGVKAIQWALNDMGYNAGTIDGGYGYATAQAVSRFQRAEGISVDGDYGPQTREKMKLRGYKTGGLADFTGPAWLDGTKARPEMVLNQKDTQNFIQLRDILASIMERGSTSNSPTENNGDITYDIDINVETIGSDYDVEQVANKVKSLIGENARYRNNNTVSLAR